MFQNDSNCNQIKNLNEIKILDELCRKNVLVKWVYVKGNSGNNGNDQADKLAKKSFLNQSFQATL